MSAKIAQEQSILQNLKKYNAFIKNFCFHQMALKITRFPLGLGEL